MPINYSQHFSTKQTPQSQPIPGKTMVKNNAGGFGFQISKWEQFDRFLVLGTEGNTYYQSEQKMTIDNAQNVIECIKEDGKRAVNRIVEVSDKGQAPKNDPAIFALALACTFGDQVTKNYAYASINKVCRIGTHLFHFTQNIQDLRGWSRGLRNGVRKYFTEHRDLSYDVIKYRQRNGWTHRDVVRLSHVKVDTKIKHNLMKWIIGKPYEGEVPKLIEEFEKMQKATSAKEVVSLLNETKLPWETIPTEFLKERSVWEALLPNIPMTALVRNLGKMTSIGMFASNLQDETKLAVERLTNKESIKKSRIHPLTALNASKVYESGQGVKGSLTWNKCGRIVDSLHEMFYTSFGNVEPTGLNWLLALDVSGSMTSGSIAGSQLVPHEAVAAMAMITARTEKNYDILGFTSGIARLGITDKDTLATAMKKTYPSNFSGTDASIPIQAAIHNKIPVDVFAIYTDNESWSGQTHVTQALTQYRKEMNRPKAKLISVGMTATNFSVVDPSDPQQMNVVGFDTGAIEAMRFFALK